MLLLILLALLAIVLFGIGFTIKWLFILAVIVALLFVISFFMGAAGGRTRGAWWYPADIEVRALCGHAAEGSLMRGSGALPAWVVAVERGWIDAPRLCELQRQQ